MELRTTLVLLGIFVASLAAAEEAYVWTDDDGVVHYSDRPVPGARKIELTEPNTGQSPAPRRTATRDQAEQEPADDEAPFRYETLEIASPRAEETLWNIDGVLNVSLALSPPLQQGHQVRAYFDGKAQIVTGTSFQVTEVWRGVHNLQAEIIDETGKMMIRSRPSRFYVQQNSVR